MVYTVSPMSAKTALTMNVPEGQAARLVRLDHAKGNYSARDASVNWFELESYNIGNATGLSDDLFCDGDTIAVPKPWSPGTSAQPPNPVQDRDAQRDARLQRVRDFLATTMSSDRCKLTDILPDIERQFVVKNSAARKLLKKAVPEGAESVAYADGRTYSLCIDHDGPGAPYPLIVVRKLIVVEAQAA